MKKVLYIILLIVEIIALLLPLLFIVAVNDWTIGAWFLLPIVAIYTFFGICAIKQKKAGNEKALKRTKILAALVSPAIFVAFAVFILGMFLEAVFFGIN